MAFNCEMLILAREAAGLTQNGFAEALDTTQGRVSKIENGLLEPTDDFLDAAAQRLGVTRSFFEKAVRRRGLGASFYRKRASVGQKEVRALEARFNLIGFDFESLVLSLDLAPLRELVTFDLDQIEGGAEEAARRLRAAWEVPIGPIGNLADLVESAGVVIVTVEDVPAKFDGMSWRPTAKCPAIIFVSKHMPADRFRFTVAHELGHLCLHTIPTDSMEDEANAFASEFLMPRDEIAPYLVSLDLNVVARLKMEWRVSMGAIIKRASTLGCLTERRARGLWIQMSRNGYTKVEPIEIRADQPHLAADLVEHHRDELGYSDDDIRRLLGRGHPVAGESYFPVNVPPSGNRTLRIVHPSA